MGYKKEQTQFYQYFSDDYPKFFKRFIEFSNLDLATSSVIKQYQEISYHGITILIISRAN